MKKKKSVKSGLNKEELEKKLKKETSALKKLKKELEIESSLGQVRAIAMGMKHPADMLEICKTISQQLQLLGVNEIRNVQTAIFYEDKGTYMNYEYYAKHDKTIITETSFTNHQIHIDFAAQMMKGKGEFFSTHITGKKKVQEWINYQKTTNVFIDSYLQTTKSLSYYWFSLGPVALGISTYHPLAEKETDLFRRFINVFELSYRRYLDIEKAEAQAREAQIEAALERVRARTMAMKKSDELLEVIQVLSQQFLNLNFKIGAATFALNYRESNDFDLWLAVPGRPYVGKIHVPYFDHALFKNFMDAKEKGLDFLVQFLSFEEKNSYFKHFFESAPGSSEEEMEWVYNSKGYAGSEVLMKSISLGIANLDAIPYTEEENAILRRLAGAFEQSYIRFLDLQKAEAQAREAQIQLALERVRARTMAMLHSDELAETAAVLFQQLVVLGFDLSRSFICFFKNEARQIEMWATTEDGKKIAESFLIDADRLQVFKKVAAAWKQKQESFVLSLQGEELQSYLLYLHDELNVPFSTAQKKRVMTAAYFSNGYIGMSSTEPQSEEIIQLLRRFASAFDQTYTRFLDLQKAEAQAREAQIELALERVRARTMAMHKSEELAETAQVLFQQLIELGDIPDRISIGLVDEANAVVHFWSTNQIGSQINTSFTARLSERTVIAKQYKAWKEHEKSLIIDLQGDELTEWIMFAREEMGIQVKDEFIKNRRIHTTAFFSHGWILVTTHDPQSTETIQILERLASVFNLTYRRFLDLQKAEAQAKEAQIEAALERVRSRSMGMQKSEELKEVIRVVYEQLVELNILVEHAGFIMDYKERDDMFIWLADKHAVPFQVTIPYFDCAHWNSFNEAKEKGKDFFANHLSFEEKNKFYQDLFKLIPGVPDETLEYYLNCPGLAISTVLLENVSLYIENFSGIPYSDEENATLMRFGKVFQQTYTRFLDLQKAEAQARESQIQLALERVRAKSLAMHHSSELQEVVNIVAEQLHNINIDINGGVFICINDEVDDDIPLWASAGATDYVQKVIVPFVNKPILSRLRDAIRQKDNFLVENYSKEEKIGFFEHLFNYAPWSSAPQKRKQELLSKEGGYTRSVAIAKLSSIAIINHNGKRFSDEDNDILKRFGNVFEQSYTRFLDLQKAEAQAKEAQIEAALERVRAASTAMHHSDELIKVATILHNQLLSLGFDSVVSGGFNFPDEENNIQKCWFAETGNKDLLQDFVIPLSGDWVLDERIEYRKKNIPFLQQILHGDEVRKHMEVVFPVHTASDNETAATNAMPVPTVFTIRFLKEGYLIWISKVPLNEEQKVIIERFASVFNLAYTRFLDLQKAEAQAREAQIEAALERVRSRTMAMHKSDELTEVAALLFKQVNDLGIKTWTTGFNVWSEDNNSYTDYITNPKGGFMPPYTIDATVLPVSIELSNAKKRGDDFFVNYEEGEPLAEVYRHLVEFGPKQFKSILDMGFEFPTSQYEHFVFGAKVSLMFITYEPVSQAHDIFKRFGKVFEQTYTRFLDLQKAEAQAREAQIEASLERVRSRTMAMHSSEDVSIATTTMFAELEKSGIENLRCGIANIRADRTMEVWSVTNAEEGKIIKGIGSFDMNVHPLWQRLFNSWKNQEGFFQGILAGKEKEDYINILNSAQNYLSEPIRELPDMNFQTYLFNEGGVWAYSLQPHSEEQKQLMKRFTSVFSLTFRRYQDLKKAEAQAREAQIEAALERVRSRTMAMHRSDELAETAVVVFKQMISLDIEPNRLYIAIINDDSGDLEFWITDENGDKVSSRYLVNVNKNISIKKMYEGWAAKRKTITIDMQGAELEAWLTYWREEFHVPFKPGVALNRRVQNIAYFSKGFVAIASPDDQPEATINLLERFAAVFNLTYTRFSDLQQAEAQVREATIEAALEKVRGKAMAMQRADELVEVAALLRKEMGSLGVEELETSSIYIHNDETGKTECWYTIRDNKDEKKLVADHMTIDLNDTWVGRQMNEFYRSGMKQTSIVMQGANRVEWINYCSEKSKALTGFYGDTIPDRTYHLYKFSSGYMGAASPGDISAESWNLLQRATSVFSLAYTRFNDLQIAEASAKEATKQAALDRVRADIASMRTTADLERITPLIWNELTVLGIPFIRCGVFIMDGSQQVIHTFLSTPDGKAIAAFHLPYDTPGNIGQALSHWRDKKNYIDHWDEPAFVELADVLVKQGAIASPEQYLSTIPHGGFYLHFLPFLQGMLYVGNTTQLAEDDIRVIQSVADAFSTAYARYEDFNKLEAAKQEVEKTLVDLKQAQTQLVQAEKMASLGELTAGIAHEIQNPLNFVNNFSEVNTELMTEMIEEVKKGNIEDAEAIANDIRQNLEKINHHGKRADSIVKGMLQHSRSNTGQKELTDINVLTDEYVRLCYHGLRAKDKSFNATIKTDFDNTIEKVNVIPQDFGRVILNLLTNAFYAVNEKRKLNTDAYEPTVSVDTKKIGNRLEIAISDNGNGISKNIIDKIFQPFFTTKPTGQGTGLGLSLAYDIITKGHGGEIKVNTQEGVGSMFAIQLPLNGLQ